ncbi:MAG TPA: hypothetical protein VFS62_17185 [Chloroflexota bacterium]|nr:hypothetical protein [Chloroflexota bacterium]
MAVRVGVPEFAATTFRPIRLAVSWRWRAMVFRALELMAIAVWTLIVTKTFVNLDPLVVPAGREYLSVIPSHQIWENLRQCGLCFLWNGSMSGGSPAFSDVESSALHPIVIVATLLFGVINGSKIALVASFFMAGVAEWLLGYVLGLSWPVRLWIAAMAVAGGDLSARLDIGAFGDVIANPSFVLMLAALLWLYRTLSLRAAVALGIATGSFMLAGNGYVELTLPFLAPTLLILTWGDWRRLLLLLRRMALSAVLALCFAAPFVVPLIHFMPNFAKDIDPSFGSAQPFAYVPLNLVIGSADFYRTNALNKDPYPYAYANYIGWLAVILAGFGVFSARIKEHVRIVWFMASMAVIAMFVSSAVPLKWLEKVPIKSLDTMVAGIRHPGPMAGIAAPIIIALAGIGLERLLRHDWKLLGLLPKGHSPFWPDVRWLVAIPLLWAANDVRGFSSNWLGTGRIDPTVQEPVLAQLKTPDTEWVNPPYGEHFWITPAVMEGLKLSPGLRPWGWINRKIPQPLLQANRGGQPPNTIPASTLFGISIWQQPGQDYAFVQSANSRSVCHAQANSGNIDVSCNAPAAGTLTVEENSWSGWNALVDGKKSALGPGQFLTLNLPAGQHTIQFRYRPWDVWLGVAIMGAGMLVAFALWRRPEPLDAELSAPFGR